MVKRISIAGCSQEVSTFNPVLSTYEDFTVVFGDDVVERSMGKNSAIAGAVGLFRADGDIEVVSSFIRCHEYRPARAWGVGAIFRGVSRCTAAFSG